MDIFILGFYVLAVVCLYLFYSTKTVLLSPNDLTFKILQTAYISVYLLGISGDWLQGPYVYALYQSYGISSHDIDILFVAGFGSSMIFGTFIGSLADKYGRRFNCVLYGVLYCLSCLTKHFQKFWILMIGRLFGGIATSILYSAFESWLFYESSNRCIDSNALGTLLSRAYLGNSIVAILCGIVAQLAANYFGFVAPFDIAFFVLTCMIIVIIFTWNENYGNAKSDLKTTFITALTHVRNDYRIIYLGLVQSIFEGCMYTFVLEWTPSLSTVRTYKDDVDDFIIQTGSTNLTSTKNTRLGVPWERLTNLNNYLFGLSGSSYSLSRDNDIPHGYIFAGFMVAIMIGSFLFKILSSKTSPESFMRHVLFVSSICFLIPILFPGHRLFIFTSFVVFEICVGIFWPSIAMLRAKYIPEESRSTIMNIFRVPLNLLVIIILLQNMKMVTIFAFCVLLLLVATYVQRQLYYRLRNSGNCYDSHKPKDIFDENVCTILDKSPLLLLKDTDIELLLPELCHTTRTDKANIA